jgi:hypothetical protein
MVYRFGSEPLWHLIHEINSFRSLLLSSWYFLLNLLLILRTDILWFWLLFGGELTRCKVISFGLFIRDDSFFDPLLYLAVYFCIYTVEWTLWFCLRLQFLVILFSWRHFLVYSVFNFKEPVLNFEGISLQIKNIDLVVPPSECFSL